MLPQCMCIGGREQRKTGTRLYHLMESVIFPASLAAGQTVDLFRLVQQYVGADGV